jgi:hypothetical protein
VGTDALAALCNTRSLSLHDFYSQGDVFTKPKEFFWGATKNSKEDMSVTEFSDELVKEDLKIEHLHVGSQGPEFTHTPCIKRLEIDWTSGEFKYNLISRLVYHHRNTIEFCNRPEMWARNYNVYFPRLHTCPRGVIATLKHCNFPRLVNVLGIHFGLPYERVLNEIVQSNRFKFRSLPTAYLCLKQLIGRDLAKLFTDRLICFGDNDWLRGRSVKKVKR